MLVYPYGLAHFNARIKSTPDDFQVVENLGFEPLGHGEHVYLQVEKTGLSSAEMLQKIAKDFAIHPRLIGYSGLKDKWALTQQWVSLHLPGRNPRKQVQQGDGYRILCQTRHRSKLRRGTHKSNSFQVQLRDVSDFPSESANQLELMTRHGMANYFGRQRFGRRQDNVAQALRRLVGGAVRGNRQSMLLSALRSDLFNRILAQRITQGYWRQALDGDVFMLSGSRSIFCDVVDDNLRARFESMDISSTASLYGIGETKLTGLPLQIEQQVFASQPEMTGLLQQQGLKRQMRPLRVAVDEFNIEFNAANQTLTLDARLPAGSYMTSLLDHFVVTV